MAPNNLFPCDVTMPDGTVHTTCRIMVSPSGTTIWGWSKAANSGVALAVTPARPVEKARNARQYTLTIDDPDGGEATIQFIHGTRCGCGAPMKRWVPPPPNIVGPG